LIHDCEIPQFLKDKKYADFRKNYSIGLVELAITLKSEVSHNFSIRSGQTIDEFDTSSHFSPSSYKGYRPKVYNLPRPVEAFVKRGKYFDEVMKTLDPENRALGAAIEGIGGVGKTTIAIEVAEQCRKEGLFERIIWTTAQIQRLVFDHENISTSSGENFYELEGLLDEIIRAFGRNSILANSIEEKHRYARKQLGNSSCLLVIDNLESVKHYEKIADFLAYIPAITKIITTTRKQYWGQGERRLHLPPMSFDEVNQLVKRLCELKQIDLPSDLKKLYDMTGGIPLAIVGSLGQFSRLPGQIDKF
jgi:LuxR family glucitol operon transcriptional activator